jgi:hypothetical protein
LLAPHDAFRQQPVRQLHVRIVWKSFSTSSCCAGAEVFERGRRQRLSEELKNAAEWRAL